MQYFVSKNHNRLNKRPFAPELVVPRLCLNPKYNVTLSRPAGEVEILLDSGAFQDIESAKRLSVSGALTRQLEFEHNVGFVSKYLVSYDRIVDESPTVQGHRTKRRVGLKTAEAYVDDTIEAAKFLADNRKDLKPRRLILSCQGVNPDQYLSCVRDVLPFAEPADVIGLGGFCIIGQVPRLTRDYYEVLEKALPLLHARRIKRLHLFGIGVFKVLIRTQVLCHRYGIQPSYDTSSVEFNSVFGKAFTPDTLGEGPAGVRLRQVFVKEDKYKLYHPRDWAMLNIRMVNRFWEELDQLYPIAERE